MVTDSEPSNGCKGEVLSLTLLSMIILSDDIDVVVGGALVLGAVVLLLLIAVIVLSACMICTCRKRTLEKNGGMELKLTVSIITVRYHLFEL